MFSNEGTGIVRYGETPSHRGRDGTRSRPRESAQHPGTQRDRGLRHRVRVCRAVRDRGRNGAPLAEAPVRSPSCRDRSAVLLSRGRRPDFCRCAAEAIRGRRRATPPRPAAQGVGGGEGAAVPPPPKPHSNGKLPAQDIQGPGDARAYYQKSQPETKERSLGTAPQPIGVPRASNTGHKLHATFNRGSDYDSSSSCRQR